MSQNNLLQHVPAFVFILKWEKKTSSHFEIISFINIYNKNPPQKDEMMMKTKPCIE